MSDDSTKLLHKIVDAWEALPGGQQQSVRAVERWLIKDMAPAIEQARTALGRSKPAAA